MTPFNFDDRARTLTRSLLTDATRVPSTVPLERAKSMRGPARRFASWKAIAVFAATALVISSAVVGASIALRSGSSPNQVPAGPGGHWKSFQLPPMDSSLAAVSCPDANYCVAVGHGGDLFVSTDPSAGPQAWKLESGGRDSAVPPSDVVTSLSCVGRSHCFAVDESGYLMMTTNISGGVQASVVILVNGAADLRGISCPAPTLCVGVGLGAVYPKPTGVVFAFSVPASWDGSSVPTLLDSTYGLTAISCPTVTFCVATDEAGNVITSSDPSGGAGAWHVSKVKDADSFTALSCPTVHFCAAVDSNGQVVTTTDPAGGAGAWTITTLGGAVKFDSISCPSAAFCVAGGLSESVFVSTHPTAGPTAWTRQRAMFLGLEPMSGLSCPSTRFCVGVDGGDANVYTNPGS